MPEVAKGIAEGTSHGVSVGREVHGQTGTPARGSVRARVEALADWPWIDCIADLGPEPGSPSLNDLLDRLHARTGRRVASVVRTGTAGLGLKASGPYLAWLPLELLVRLPGRPLSPLPLEFGRRCPTGVVLRRSAEGLVPVRAGLCREARQRATRQQRIGAARGPATHRLGQRQRRAARRGCPTSSTATSTRPSS